jgi:hypothetical protein
MSYGLNTTEAASLVDHGRPAPFRLTLNLNTAQSRNLTIPSNLIARASESTFRPCREGPFLLVTYEMGVNRTYLSKLEMGASNGVGNHHQARHCAGMRAGGAAQSIQPAEHVTLHGSRKRPNTPRDGLAAQMLMTRC